MQGDKSLAYRRRRVMENEALPVGFYFRLGILRLYGGKGFQEYAAELPYLLVSSAELLM